jgi:methionyl-tRNA formyltransferase
VAARAEGAGVAVVRPERLRGNAELRQLLEAIAPDVGVVVAYGRILPAEILAVPRLGFVNVHASLLPRHRGASPVAAALLAGDPQTGVSTMRVIEELDAGPVYLQRSVAIGAEENAGQLSRRLSQVGAELLVETLRGLSAGTLSATPQSGPPTFCRPLSREDGEVDWTRPAEELVRRLRAFSPWPGLYSFLGAERIKILEAQALVNGGGHSPGTLWQQGGETRVAAGEDTALVLRRVQRAGKKPVAGEDFLRGVAKLPARLGKPPAAG